jgi:hypothetical protein
MSFRALNLCLLLVLVGCSGAEDVGEPALDATQIPQATLAFETGDTTLLPNRELTITAVYTDATGTPQPDVLVDFSLTTSAAGASLSPSRALTDAHGSATTTLRAGSTSGNLEIRARAGSNAFAYLMVAVQPALGTTLKVGVHYAGARPVTQYTVTSVPSMTCAQALSTGLAGELSYNFSAPDQQASFSIGYGLTAAIIGWGKDATGAKLVRGCKDFTAQVTADSAAAQKLLTLELTDIDLALKAALELELEVNVTQATRRYEDACTRAVAAVVSPNAAYSMFADADYLLDAVQNTLTAMGNATGAAGLAARRTAGSLAAVLQPQLLARGVGPTAYGAAIGKALAQRSASIDARWTLGSATLSSFSALSADGSQAVAFRKLPETSIVTSFQGDAATLSFDQLRIALGLGAYGQTVLASITDDERSASAGCGSVFAAWWNQSALTDLVPVADAEAACDGAFKQLDSAIRSELGKLDTSATLSLTGSVQAHARSDDGMVDDLGPSLLSGTWGSDAIEAEVRVPQRTAFE